MGISGFVTGGINDALAEAVQRRMEEEARLQREQMAQAQLQLQRDSLSSQNAEREAARAERLRNFELDKLQRIAEQDEAAMTTRARANMAGVAEMGLDPATTQRELLTTSLRSGAEIPRGVLDLIKIPEVKRHAVTTRGPNGRPLRKLVTEDELSAGVEEYREPTQGPAPEKPSVWVSKGSDMRFVTPSEASRLSGEGWRSGQTREQGRPVMSSDANRVADLDTSLDDLKTLSAALGGGGTGAASKVGAMMPNVVTEMTGWGADAKSRQAVINRVKQVIGKALEGGVLRKEDEEKYKQILPTIYDPPDVATSKLQGLATAIAQRRQTLLDALSDSGYDTTRFTERSGGEGGGASRLRFDRTGKPIP